MEQPPPLSQAAQQPVSVSALISSLHQIYTHNESRSLQIDSESALLLSQSVPPEFMEMVWQHAYRRAEDELVMVMPTDKASLPVFLNAVIQFPGVDPSISQALTALMPFLTAMTPANLNEAFHNGVSVVISLNSEGSVVSARLSLSEQPFVSLDPLLHLPSEKDHRAFDVFYHLLYSQEDRSDVLSLKDHPSKYNLLSPSSSYTLPDWVVFSDDRALAKDWYDALHQCLPAEFCRDVLTTLSGILLLGNTSSADRAEGASLIGLDHALSSQYTQKELISATYIELLRAVVTSLNRYLASFDLQDSRTLDGAASINDITSVVTILECAQHHRVDLLQSVFDNNMGLNSEMVANGISVPKPASNVKKAIQKLVNTPFVAPSFSAIHSISSITDTSVTWPRLASLQAREDFPPSIDLHQLMPSNRIWALLPLAPSNTSQGTLNDKWSSPVVSAQIREFFITEWAAKRATVDYTADFGVGDYISWFRAILPDGPTGFQVDAWAQSRGYGPADFFSGQHRIYISEPVWQELEHERQAAEGTFGGYSTFTPQQPSAPFAPASAGMQSLYSFKGIGAGGPRSELSMNPLQSPAFPHDRQIGDPAGHAQQPLQSFYDPDGHIQQVDADLGSERYYADEDSEYDEHHFLQDYKDAEKEGGHIEVYTQTTGRKIWVAFVWLCTFWIPSPILKWIFGMKRKDVRLAWREKLVIFALIFMLNAAIIFYMIFLGRFICPDYDKVWNHKQMATHQGTNDFYVGIHGHVYDITKFYKLQHSDSGTKVTEELMLPMAGEDISDYFPPPLTVACPSLVDNVEVSLLYNTTASPYSVAMHKSGTYLVPSDKTVLHNYTWYNQIFQPGIQKYYKGDIVETAKNVQKITDADPTKYLFIINKKVYDLSNYFLTSTTFPVSDSPYYERYAFFPSAFVNMVSNYQGQDISDHWMTLDEATQKKTLECLDNAFYYAKIDFRNSAKCQAANVILLVIAGILTSITIIKFITSIRFGTKPLPSPQDRFVICQIPAYTESEDELRLAIDSLTNLDYDNQRKLLFIVCDGMIVGAGNDRPTPQIVLDILGVDDRLDPEPKAYHAIAEGSKELNYAKVYSGLYENEGNIVPYICIVKIGNPTEESRPGNRGKRDSQIILMNFLNRVHRQSAMSPLDLELFHQINNVIGVEPERYDYLFTVDADTKVLPDSLTRLVAACTNDNKIAAVCGETGIQNEQQSLSTMVQVYEYFISHHLTKAFESLFGSVTCLPGCFSLFRLRTAQRFKPLIISEEVIHEYSVRHVDTLHKKNLFSLGEDRYLTTLMSKHFPRMTYRFVADARCQTRVPDDFSILMSQRRRWINSTVHNLVELLRLKTMCGFFMFSMRGVVFVDLLGTMMLPSVVIYLGYLIYVIASHASPLPLISIVLIAAVYGLQALVFIMHRRWQYIIWMLIYIAAYPFHSFLLPIYSFWNMDNFSWGNTRIVVDESKGKKVVLQDDNDVFDPRWVPFESWSTYASREGLPGGERAIVFDDRKGRIHQDIFDQAPVISSGMSMKTGAQSMYSQTPTAVYGAAESVFDRRTIAEIRATVKEVLNTADLDATTTKQLRSKVGDLMNIEFSGERAIAVDEIIDEELELLDEDEDEILGDGFESPAPFAKNGPFDA